MESQSNNELAAMDGEMAERLTKLARFESYGIDKEALADSFGLTPEELVALQTLPVYQGLLSEAKGKTTQTDIDTDIGWDSLEAKALENLETAVKWSKDPTLNLAIATAANKAQRRVRPQRKVLDANHGARVVLKLSNRMIKRVNEATVETTESVEVEMDLEEMQANGRPSVIDLQDVFGNAVGLTQEQSPKIVPLPDIIDVTPEEDMASAVDQIFNEAKRKRAGLTPMDET